MKRLYSALIYLAAGAGLLLGQSYNGGLDTATCASITGWAWDGTNTPIYVDIYDGTVYLTSVLANVNDYNPEGWDYINGVYHGFILPTPSSLKDNQVHTIYARYGGTTTNVSVFPLTLQCDSTSPGYQYYYTDTLQSLNGRNWAQYGSLLFWPNLGLQATSSTGGALASKLAVQGPSTTKFEVNMTWSSTRAAETTSHMTFRRSRTRLAARPPTSRWKSKIPPSQMGPARRP